MGPRDGWRRKKNATIVLIAVTSYSGGQKGVGIANNQWTLIDLPDGIVTSENT